MARMLKQLESTWRMISVPPPRKPRFFDMTKHETATLFEVKLSESKGRSFVATEPIVPGQLVLRSKAYAAIPDSETKGCRCSQCLAEVQKFEISAAKCEDCGILICPECAVSREEQHALECRLLQELCCDDDNRQPLSEYAKDYCWLIFRCLMEYYNELNLATDSTKVLDETDRPCFEDVWELCSNRDSFEPERQEEFRRVAKIIKPHSKQAFKLNQNVQHSFIGIFNDEELIYELICKEECNSFGLYHYETPDSDRKSYGLAIFPKAVFFNHSCCPNVVHLTHQNDELFFCVKPIAPGEELTISYISTSGKSKEERQSELFGYFHFKCDCSSCAHDIDLSVTSPNSVRCLRPGCFGTCAPFNNDGKLALNLPDNHEWNWRCIACFEVKTTI